jgi:DNA-directed RNA polymerase alpha subunit
MVLELIGRKSYLSPSTLDEILTADEREIIRLRSKHRGGMLDGSTYRPALVLSDGLHGIGLSFQALRALWNAGVHTLEDVAQLTEDELLAIKHVGPKTVEILRVALDAHGRELGG